MAQNGVCGTFDVSKFKARLLKFALDFAGLGTTAFEDKCGLSHGAIGTIKVKGPSVEVLAKISSAFPELNLHWLITGVGPMFLPKGEKNLVPQNDIHDNATVNINYVELKDVIVEAIKEATR